MDGSGHSRMHYIAPGRPNPNVFIGSLIGRLRDELLNRLFSRHWRTLDLHLQIGAAITTFIDHTLNLTG
jgi:hypothetical protein